MSDYQGSRWRKWDLHVHTPFSREQGYGSGEKAWEKFIEDLESLPSDFSVIGVNDYLFLDGYKRLKEAKKDNGRLQNIDLLVPVIEFRLKQFSGLEGKWERVNFHVIFSPEIGTEQLEDYEVISQQFINSLNSEYQFSHRSQEQNIRWNGKLTKDSLRDFGRSLRESLPKEKEDEFDVSNSKLGFDHINFELSAIKNSLDNHFFKDNNRSKRLYITAVGKTEWSNLEWSKGSIGDKKDVINQADLVFTASESEEKFQNGKQKLSDQGVNNLLLDCSDAHYFSSSNQKDSIGNCLTWIKADPTFEGLRQILFEPNSRKKISKSKPPKPLYTIDKVKFDFPEESKLGNEPFCFRGKEDFSFSPYFNCLIGGRGTGKSTTLNLIYENIESGSTKFFQENEIELPQGTSIQDFVEFENEGEEKYVEFFSQDEIENFARQSQELTSAIFKRIKKQTDLDSEKDLNVIEKNLMNEVEGLQRVLDSYKTKQELQESIEKKKAKLKTTNNILNSLKSDKFKDITGEIEEYTNRLSEIRDSKSKLSDLKSNIKALLDSYEEYDSQDLNPYEKALNEALRGLNKIYEEIESKNFEGAKEKEIELEDEIDDKREELESFLEDKGLSDENLKDMSEATQERKKLKTSLEDLQKKLNKQEKTIENFDIGELSELKSEFEESINDSIKPLSDTLNELTKEGNKIGDIDLEYEFDEKLAKDNLLKDFESFFKDFEWEWFPREDYLRDYLFTQSPHEEFTRKELIDSIKNTEDLNKTQKFLVELFQEKDFFEVYKLLIQKNFNDIVNFKSLQVTYDGKFLNETSFGQRCTAILLLFLAIGNNPIIIDEPEAHLDSALIAQNLVKLIKRKKPGRQIIFATHNANFVVNGDAELIHILDMEDKRTTLTQTTIEDLEHRDELMNLEGGNKAFSNREEKY